MNSRELAGSFRRIADALDKCEEIDLPHEKPMLTEDQQVGALIIIDYLRELLTTGDGRQHFDRPSLQKVLDLVAGDPELFYPGLSRLMRQE